MTHGDTAKKYRYSKGFTLIEMLIVLVIIGLLASLVGPSLYQKIKPAKQAIAKVQINNFGTALDSFFIDVGRYPTEEEGLEALRSPVQHDKWKGPYIKKDIPVDPWGRPYVYHSPGQRDGYDIISYGADGKEGGESENKDVTSWE